MYLMLRGALCVVVLCLSACAGVTGQQTADSETQARTGSSESVCPTASSTDSLSLFGWRTQRYADRAVWSGDGTLVAGVETAYEEKKSWDPLNGTTEKRRNCHRVFVQRPDGSGRRYLGEDAPGQVGTMFLMRQGSDASAYLLLQVYIGNGLAYDRVALDGQRARIAKDADRRKNLVPSPDGRTLAQVTIDPCKSPEGPFTEVPTEVRMLTDQGVLRGSPQTITAPCNSLGFTFRPDGAFVVTDGVRAHAFDTGGNAATATSIPRCVSPPTTSSRVDAQGRVLELVDGKLRVSAPKTEVAFGCQ